ncbi:hypothetical protein AMAG_04928 [Allomyces macrogynus ATCC 38327]|uniref:Uncharacterized protein n=1 Tax=Allomyces macrogynus (strain ATCC 38327) TaxID=578462 RepID=A0A0L0S696_ALLM3|nr:hypothetical protein AMAG_04928 [Allomyces macrogynus ATCC 38327]|eukprot:KNE58108.1 hypothetical protein AMAG_04928 [Allomyces macrogynus ATCC 38327]
MLGARTSSSSSSTTTASASTAAAPTATSPTDRTTPAPWGPLDAAATAADLDLADLVDRFSPLALDPRHAAVAATAAEPTTPRLPSGSADSMQHVIRAWHDLPNLNLKASELAASGLAHGPAGLGLVGVNANANVTRPVRGGSGGDLDGDDSRVANAAFAASQQQQYHQQQQQQYQHQQFQQQTYQQQQQQQQAAQQHRYSIGQDFHSFHAHPQHQAHHLQQQQQPHLEHQVEPGAMLDPTLPTASNPHRRSLYMAEHAPGSVSSTSSTHTPSQPSTRPSSFHDFVSPGFYPSEYHLGHPDLVQDPVALAAGGGNGAQVVGTPSSSGSPAMYPSAQQQQQQQQQPFNHHRGSFHSADGKLATVTEMAAAPAHFYPPHQLPSSAAESNEASPLGTPSPGTVAAAGQSSSAPGRRRPSSMISLSAVAEATDRLLTAAPTQRTPSTELPEPPAVAAAPKRAVGAGAGSRTSLGLFPPPGMGDDLTRGSPPVPGPMGLESPRPGMNRSRSTPFLGRATLAPSAAPFYPSAVQDQQASEYQPSPRPQHQSLASSAALGAFQGGHPLSNAAYRPTAALPSSQSEVVASLRAPGSRLSLNLPAPGSPQPHLLHHVPSAEDLSARFDPDLVGGGAPTTPRNMKRRSMPPMYHHHQAAQSATDSNDMLAYGSPAPTPRQLHRLSAQFDVGPPPGVTRAHDAHEAAISKRHSFAGFGAPGSSPLDTTGLEAGAYFAAPSSSAGIPQRTSSLEAAQYADMPGSPFPAHFSVHGHDAYSGHGGWPQQTPTLAHHGLQSPAPAFAAMSPMVSSAALGPMDVQDQQQHHQQQHMYHRRSFTGGNTPVMTNAGLVGARSARNAAPHHRNSLSAGNGQRDAAHGARRAAHGLGARVPRTPTRTPAPYAGPHARDARAAADSSRGPPPVPATASVPCRGHGRRSGAACSALGRAVVAGNEFLDRVADSLARGQVPVAVPGVLVDLGWRSCGFPFWVRTAQFDRIKRECGGCWVRERGEWRCHGHGARWTARGRTAPGRAARESAVGAPVPDIDCVCACRAGGPG